MLKSVEGVYKHGKIKLVKLPLDVSEIRARDNPKTNQDDSVWYVSWEESVYKRGFLNALPQNRKTRSRL